MKEMFLFLAAHGGCIVSSASCTEIEIEIARTEGRMHVEDDLGYIWRPPAVVVTMEINK